jgi:hypothetical protein
MDKILAAFFAIAGVFLIIILLSLLFIKLGWYLFMVPVFGLPDLTWMQALGFSFLASAFRSSGVNKKE